MYRQRLSPYVNSFIKTTIQQAFREFLLEHEIDHTYTVRGLCSFIYGDIDNKLAQNNWCVDEFFSSYETKLKRLKFCETLIAHYFVPAPGERSGLALDIKSRSPILGQISITYEGIEGIFALVNKKLAPRDPSLRSEKPRFFCKEDQKDLAYKFKLSPLILRKFLTENELVAKGKAITISRQKQSSILKQSRIPEDANKQILNIIQQQLKLYYQKNGADWRTPIRFYFNILIHNQVLKDCELKAKLEEVGALDDEDAIKMHYVFLLNNNFILGVDSTYKLDASGTPVFTKSISEQADELNKYLANLAERGIRMESKVINAASSDITQPITFKRIAFDFDLRVVDVALAVKKLEHRVKSSTVQTKKRKTTNQDNPSSKWAMHNDNRKDINKVKISSILNAGSIPLYPMSPLSNKQIDQLGLDENNERYFSYSSNPS